ncbi:MAG: DUF3379 family protein [Xanthomonadales bacterium]|nr:DUF3379 family protein [Xanthomonadales bacterium]
MDFSEFQRRLGADPSDPALAKERTSGPEFEEAAVAAQDFEQVLIKALCIPAPNDLLDNLKSIPTRLPGTGQKKPWALALAASLLMTAGAVGLLWNTEPAWDSVDEYVADHYRHDGYMLVEMVGSHSGDEARALLARFDVGLADEFADVVSVVKSCPTPDGKGVHMVLNTAEGPITVIYMPKTTVNDREMLEFDELQAMLVQLDSGSAAIIGNTVEQVAGLYPMVDRAIRPYTERS